MTTLQQHPVPRGLVTGEPLAPDPRILILAPRGRDGGLVERVLGTAGFSCDVCDDPARFPVKIEHIGAVLLTAEALTPRVLGLLNAALDAQPAWSSTPVILLFDAHPPPAHNGTHGAGVVDLERRAIILHRPVLPATLISVVRSALESRARQYQVRDLHAGMENKVAKQTAKLRAMALDLIRAEQEERRRLAHLLHDHLQQLLVAAKMHMELLKLPENDPGNREAAHMAKDLLMQSIQASQSLVMDLSPPILERGGLAQALRWLGDEMHTRHKLRVTVRAEEGIKTHDLDVAAFLFEATRELLFNTVKHAKVDKATVTVTRVEGEVRIAVEDHGAGLPKAADRGRHTAGGFGLSSIRERLDVIGGRLEMDTPSEGGCKITICAPAMPRPGNR